MLVDFAFEPFYEFQGLHDDGCVVGIEEPDRVVELAAERSHDLETGYLPELF